MPKTNRTNQADTGPATNLRSSGGSQRLMAALAIAALSVVGQVLLWNFSPPAPVSINLGDREATVSHFYAPESGDGVSYRWTRTFSAVSVPALASSQAITITLNPARPDREPVEVVLSTVDMEIAAFQAGPGWNEYGATAGPRLAPDIRLLIDSDWFYPGETDRRRLGVAVASVKAEPRAGRLGFLLPPLLWLVIAGLAPLLGAATQRSGYRLVISAIAAMLATWLLRFALPPNWALPVAAWATGILAAALLLKFLQHALREDEGRLARASAVIERRELPFLILVLTICTVAITWPLTSRIDESLPGWPGDNFAFLYKLWWFRTAIVELGVSPLFDPNSYAPFGFNLGQGEPTLLNTIPGTLVGALLNDVVSYNLLALSSFIISGLGAYYLVREVTGSRSAAFLAALAFAFCPYRMAQYSGHLQLLGTGWIAFAFYFAERTVRTSRLIYGGLMGLALALTALSAWYYAYMVGLAVALYFVVRAVQVKGGSLIRAYIVPAIAGITVLAVLVAPVAIPSLQLWSQGGLTHSAKAADEHSAAPLDFVVPNQIHPVWGEPSMRAHAEQNVIESSLYLGLLPLVAIIFAAVLALRRRFRVSTHGWVWAGLLIATFVLSLGLTLHDERGQVQIGGPAGPQPISLPGRILYDWLPLYSSMRAYARFGVLTMLAATVLLGLVWAWQVSRAGSLLARNFRFALVVAAALILVDFWTAPFPWGTSRVQATGASRFLSAAPPGLVMQMPLASSQSGPALYWGTYYGKPIAYGYDTFEPPEWRAARPTLESFPEDRSLDVLSSWGVRYIVVSANAYGADWQGMSDFLNGLPRLRHHGDFKEPRTWDVDPGVLDARPDMEEFALPNILSVYEIVP